MTTFWKYFGAVMLVVGFVGGWLLKPDRDCPTLRLPTTTAAQVVDVDTVRVVHLPEPVRITTSAPRTRAHGPVVAHVDTVYLADTVRFDTVLMAQPFQMALDTISGGDTIQVQASFPPPTLAISIQHQPDTAITRTRTIMLTQEVDGATWYEEAGKGVFYAACGYLARVLTEPSGEWHGNTDRARLPPGGVAPSLAISLTVGF